jgi:hypothetical protein
VSFGWPDGSFTIPHVTSEFNPARKNPVTGIITAHEGIDLVGFDLNKSAGPGVVTFAQYNGGAGNEVRVLHDNGKETRYKHNARFLVAVRQRVDRGTALGVQGTTGNSTGKHLHFETRDAPRGRAINPRIFMAANVTAGGSGTPITPTITEEEEDMRILRNEGGVQYLMAHPLPASGRFLQLDTPNAAALVDAGVVVYDTAHSNIVQLERILAAVKPAGATAAEVWAWVTGHAPAWQILAASANEGTSIERHAALVALISSIDGGGMTDEQAAALGASLAQVVPTREELQRQWDAQTTQLLTAIAALPEATLAGFGLKRA